MQLLQSPTRLAFAPAEMNAARRALFRLVSDFGADIQPEKSEWTIQLGAESAQIRLDNLNDSGALNSTQHATVLSGINAAGEKLLEVLWTSLRLEWRDPAKGPTHLRPQLNARHRLQIANILAVLK